jgi:D-lactate dehydrogenase
MNKPLADGADAVCIFVNDGKCRHLQQLAEKGVRSSPCVVRVLIMLTLWLLKKWPKGLPRSAYSPEAVAEHALALIMTLNRKTHKAYNRVREQNFSLNGLLGFNIHGKTVGVIGTGNIGKAFCRIMLGMGCRVLAFDLIANKEMEALGVQYHPLIEVFKSDIISIHSPLNEQTKHLVNDQTIAMMKKGVMLINTSRGGLIDTPAALKGAEIRPYRLPGNRCI